jgi:hypothetical protein
LLDLRGSPFHSRTDIELPIAFRASLNERYVALWHNPDLQRLPGLGPLTGA